MVLYGVITSLIMLLHIQYENNMKKTDFCCGYSINYPKVKIFI